MNRIHRVVWNTIRCAFVAVNETTASRGKASKSERKGTRRTPLAKLAAAVMLALGVTGHAQAATQLTYDLVKGTGALTSDSGAQNWIFADGKSATFDTTTQYDLSGIQLDSMQLITLTSQGSDPHTTFSVGDAVGTMRVNNLTLKNAGSMIHLGGAGALKVAYKLDMNGGEIKAGALYFGDTESGKVTATLNDNSYLDQIGTIDGWVDMTITKTSGAQASDPKVEAAYWYLKGSLNNTTDVTLHINNLTSQGATITNQGTITGSTYEQNALENHADPTFTGGNLMASTSAKINAGTFDVVSLGTKDLWVAAGATAKIGSLSKGAESTINVRNAGTTTIEAVTGPIGALENNRWEPKANGTLTIKGDITVTGDFIIGGGVFNADNIDVHNNYVWGNQESWSWVQLQGGQTNISGELKADVVKISSGAKLNVKTLTQYENERYVENAGTLTLTGNTNEIADLRNASTGTVSAKALTLKEELVLNGGSVHATESLAIAGGTAVTSGTSTASLTSDKTMLIDGSSTGDWLTLTNVNVTAGESLTLNRQTTFAAGTNITVTAPTLNANANADFTGVTLKADSIHVTQGTTKVSKLVASSDTGDGKTDVTVDKGTTFAYTGSVGNVGTLTLNGTFDASDATNTLNIDTIVQGTNIGLSDFNYTSGNGVTVDVSGAADFTKLNVTSGASSFTFNGATTISEVVWSGTGGTLNLNGASTIGDLTLSNGTANVAATATVDSLVLTGGTFNVKDGASVTLGYVGADTGGSTASGGSITVGSNAALTLSATDSNTNNHFNIGSLTLASGSTLTNNNQTVNITKLTQSDAVTYNQTGDDASFTTSNNAVFKNSAINISGGVFNATATAGTSNTYTIKRDGASSLGASGSLVGSEWLKDRALVQIGTAIKSEGNTYHIQEGGVLQFETFDKTGISSSSDEFIFLEGGSLYTDLNQLFVTGESKQVAMEKVEGVGADGSVTVSVENYLLPGNVTSFKEGVEDAIHFGSGSLVFSSNYDVGMLNSVQELVSKAVTNDNGSNVTIHYTGTSTQIFTPSVANTIKVTPNVEAILSSTTLYASKDGVLENLTMDDGGDPTKDLTVSIGFKDIVNANKVTVTDGMKLALVGSAVDSLEDASYLITGTGQAAGEAALSGQDAKLYLGSEFLSGYKGKLANVTASDGALVQVRAGEYSIDNLQVSAGAVQVDANAKSVITDLSVTDGTVTNSGDLTVKNDAAISGSSSTILNADSTTTFEKSLSAAGSFTSAGSLSVAGTTTLSGEASFTGGTATFTGALTASDTLKQTGTSQINVQGSGSSIATFTQESGSRLSVADGADLTITDASGLNGTVVSSGALAVTRGTISDTATTDKTGAIYLTADGSLDVSGQLALADVGLELTESQTAQNVTLEDLAQVGSTTISGKLAAGTVLLGATTISGSGELVNNGDNGRIAALTMTGGTLNNQGTLTVHNGVDGATRAAIAGLTQGANSGLTVEGNVDFIGKASEVVGGTVAVNGDVDGDASAVTIANDAAYSFNSLTVSNGATEVLGSLGGNNLTFNGLLKFDGANSAYTGTESSTLTINSGLTVTGGAQITIAGLTVQTAEESGTTNLTTVDASSKLTASNAKLSDAKVAGTLAVSGTSTIKNLSMDSSGSLENAGHLTVGEAGNGSVTIFGLKQNAADNTLLVQADSISFGQASTQGAASVNNGTIDATGKSVTIAGTGDVLSGTGTLKAGSLTVDVGAQAAQTTVTVTDGDEQTPALTTIGAGARLTADTLTLQEAQVAGTLSGTGTIDSFSGVSADSVLIAAGTGDKTLSVATIETVGTLTLDGALTAGDMTLKSTAKVGGDGQLLVNKTLTVTDNAAVTLANVNAAHAATQIDTGASLTAGGGTYGAVTVDGTFNVEAGNGTVTVSSEGQTGFGGDGKVSLTSGNLVSNGTDTIATFDQQGGTADFQGKTQIAAWSQTLDAVSSSFTDLTLTGTANVTAGLVTADTLAINGTNANFNVSLTAGTLAANTGTTSVENLTVNKALTLAADATLTAGTSLKSSTSSDISGHLINAGTAELAQATINEGAHLQTSGALTLHTTGQMTDVTYSQYEGGSLVLDESTKTDHFFKDSTLNIYGGNFKEKTYGTLGTGNTYNVGGASGAGASLTGELPEVVQDRTAVVWTNSALTDANIFNLKEGGALVAYEISDTISRDAVFLQGGTFVTSIDSFFTESKLEDINLDDNQGDGEVDVDYGQALVDVGGIKTNVDAILGTQDDATGTIVFDDAGQGDLVTAGAAAAIIDRIGDLFTQGSSVDVVFSSKVTAEGGAGFNVATANEVVGSNDNVRAIITSADINVEAPLVVTGEAKPETGADPNTIYGSIGFAGVDGTTSVTVQNGAHFALVGYDDDKHGALIKDDTNTDSKGAVTVNDATFSLGTTYTGKDADNPLNGYTGSLDSITATNNATVNIRGGDYQVGTIDLTGSTFDVYVNATGSVTDLKLNGTDADVDGTLLVENLTATGGTLTVSHAMTVTNAAAGLTSAVQVGNADVAGSQGNSQLSFQNGFTAGSGSSMSVTNGGRLLSTGDVTFESGSEGLTVDNGVAIFGDEDTQTKTNTAFNGANMTVGAAGGVDFTHTNTTFAGSTVTIGSGTDTRGLAQFGATTLENSSSVENSGYTSFESLTMKGSTLAGKGDSVTIVTSLTAGEGAGTVTNEGTMNIGTVAQADGATLAITNTAGSLSVESLDAADSALTNEAGATLVIGRTDRTGQELSHTIGSLVNNGAAAQTAAAGQTTAGVVIYENLTVNDTFTNAQDLTAWGTLTLAGATGANSATMTVLGSLDVTGALTNEAAGQIDTAALSVTGTLTNAGNIGSEDLLSGLLEVGSTDAAAGTYATGTGVASLDNSGGIWATQMNVYADAQVTNSGAVNVNELHVSGSYKQTAGSLAAGGVHFASGEMSFVGTAPAEGSEESLMEVYIPLMDCETAAGEGSTFAESATQGDLASVGGQLIVSNAKVTVGVKDGDGSMTELGGMPEDVDSILVAALPDNTSLHLGREGGIYVGGDALTDSTTIGAGDTYFASDSMLVMNTGRMQTISNGGVTLFYGNGQSGKVTFEKGAQVYISNLGYGRYYFSYGYADQLKDEADASEGSETGTGAETGTGTDTGTGTQGAVGAAEGSDARAGEGQTSSEESVEQMLEDLKNNTTWDKTKYPTKTVRYELNENGDIILVVGYDNITDLYPDIAPSETWDEVLQDENLHNSNRDDVIGLISKSMEDTYLSEEDRVETINTASQIGAAGQQYTQAARMTVNVTEMAERHMSFEDAHFSHGNLLRWQGARVWANAIGQQMSSSGYDFTGGSSDYDGQNWGAVLGVDFIGDNDVRGGLAFAAQRGQIETRNCAVTTSNTSDAYSLVAYLAKNSGNFNFIGSLGLNVIEHEISQKLPASMQLGAHTMDADNVVFSASGKAEYRLALTKGIDLVPYVGVRSLIFKGAENTSKLGGADAFTYDVATQVQWQFPVGVAMQFEGENRGWTGKGLVDLSVIPVAGDTRYDGMLSGAGLSARDDYAADFTDKFSTQLRVGGMLGNGTFSYGADVSARVNDSGDTDMTVNLKARMAF